MVDVTLDKEAIERVADGPEYEVALSVPPEQISAAPVGILYGVLYKLDQAVRSTPHLRVPRHAGLRELRVDARQAARDGKLVDLICAAATIPPVFDVPRMAGLPRAGWRDAGQGPAAERLSGRDAGPADIALSPLPEVAGRTYAQPSSEVAADKIDFTDASKVTRTWDQGVRDGKAWLAKQARAGLKTPCMTDSLTIRRPDDWHVHLRDGAMLRAVAATPRASSPARS